MSAPRASFPGVRFVLLVIVMISTVRAPGSSLEGYYTGLFHARLRGEDTQQKARFLLRCAGITASETETLCLLQDRPNCLPKGTDRMAALGAETGSPRLLIDILSDGIGGGYFTSGAKGVDTALWRLSARDNFIMSCLGSLPAEPTDFYTGFSEEERELLIEALTGDSDEDEVELLRQIMMGIPLTDRYFSRNGFIFSMAYFNQSGDFQQLEQDYLQAHEVDVRRTILILLSHTRATEEAAKCVVLLADDFALNAKLGIQYEGALVSQSLACLRKHAQSNHVVNFWKDRMVGRGPAGFQPVFDELLYVYASFDEVTQRENRWIVERKAKEARRRVDLCEELLEP